MTTPNTGTGTGAAGSTGTGGPSGTQGRDVADAAPAGDAAGSEPGPGEALRKQWEDERKGGHESLLNTRSKSRQREQAQEQIDRRNEAREAQRAAQERRPAAKRPAVPVAPRKA